MTTKPATNDHPEDVLAIAMYVCGVRYVLATDAEARVQALQREVEELRADKARLIEDRARFPDRPDDIGAMIGAHYNNLKATAKANEDAWRRAQLNADANALAAARYELVRTLTARQFVDLWERGLSGEQFDFLVDAALAAKAEVPNG